jgi:hypothetical protein
MNRAIWVFVVLGLMAAPAMGTIGETWTLPIDHRNGTGWTEYPGAGYGGASAWGAITNDGVRRVYWELSGTGDMGHTPPATTELYTIEFYDPTAGGDQWQPIESQFNGVDGETYPIEPNIPWVGAFGTNHEWIGSQGSLATGGTWVATGPGPHTPESADYSAGPNGIYMWLEGGSWLYAKWDFGTDTDRAWSAIRLTQVTPEPASALLLALGGAALLRRRRSA